MKNRKKFADYSIPWVVFQLPSWSVCHCVFGVIVQLLVNVPCNLISTDFGMFYLEVKMTLHAILYTMWIVLCVCCTPNTLAGAVSWQWEHMRAGGHGAPDCIYSRTEPYQEGLHCAGKSCHIHLILATANIASAKLNASLPGRKVASPPLANS